MHQKTVWPMVSKPEGGEEVIHVGQVVAAALCLLSENKRSDRSIHTAGRPCPVLGEHAHRVLNFKRGKEGIHAKRHKVPEHRGLRDKSLMRNRKFTEPERTVSQDTC